MGFLPECRRDVAAPKAKEPILRRVKCGSEIPAVGRPSLYAQPVQGFADGREAGSAGFLSGAAGLGFSAGFSLFSAAAWALGFSPASILVGAFCGASIERSPSDFAICSSR